MSNLPPGVTDSMIENHYADKICANCNHFWSEHLTDEEVGQRYSEGEVYQTKCDGEPHCPCSLFEEKEYEGPDPDDAYQQMKEEGF